MTLKSKSKISGMCTKSRTGLGCALMTVKSKSKVCTLNKKNRMELGCAIMTIKSKSKVCGMHKRSRVELGYRLTNWLMFLCGQIQSPRLYEMPDRREGIARAEGFVAAHIETSFS